MIINCRVVGESDYVQPRFTGAFIMTLDGFLLVDTLNVGQQYYLNLSIKLQTCNHSALARQHNAKIGPTKFIGLNANLTFVRNSNSFDKAESKPHALHRTTGIYTI